MKRSSNVVQFPSDNQNGFRLKIFAVLFYLFVAYLLTFGTGLSEEGLWGLVLFGGMYGYLIKEQAYKRLKIKPHEKTKFMVIGVLLLVIFLWLYKIVAVLALILAGMYWLLVGRTGREAPYFLKFHLLTALIFNFFLLMPYLIVNAIIVLIGHSLSMAHLAVPAAVLGDISHHLLPQLMTGLLWGAGLWLAASVILGRTPYIALVSSNVRPWV